VTGSMPMHCKLFRQNVHGLITGRVLVVLKTESDRGLLEIRNCHKICTTNGFFGVNG
jgi:hypothetical protein